MMSTIINILLVLGVLSILVFVHELGHFIAAKLCNVRVDEFAIGMGPKLLKKKVGETLYSFNIFPIGGYVKILGEGDDPDVDMEALKNDPRSFTNKTPLQKFFILIAGVTMNLILAVILYYVIMFASDFKFFSLSNYKEDYKPLFGQEQIVPDDKIKYVELVDDGGAQKAGLPDEGYVKTFNGETFQLSSMFSKAISENAGETVDLTICSDSGLSQNCERYNAEVSKEGKLGVVLEQNFAQLSYEGIERWFVGFIHPVNILHQSIEYIPQVIKESAQSSCNKALGVVASPLALYVIVDEFGDQGGISWLFIVDLIASLSFTLFIMNLLPIPALDGGRIVFVLYEAIFKKPVNPMVEAWSVRISFALLLLFMAAVFFKDIFFFSDLVCTISG